MSSTTACQQCGTYDDLYMIIGGVSAKTLCAECSGFMKRSEVILASATRLLNEIDSKGRPAPTSSEMELAAALAVFLEQASRLTGAASETKAK